MLSISEFLDRNSKGFARPNKYEVYIKPRNFSSIIANNVAINCEYVELPGRMFATADDTNWGPTRKMPYSNIYTDVRMSFICSEDMRERKFFDDWHDLIMSKEDHLVEYYEKYISDMTIKVCNEKNQRRYTIELLEAFPLEVVPQQLSYGENDTYLRLDVQIAYRSWSQKDNFSWANVLFT